MIAFERDALQPLRFCSLHCGRIAEHEAVVLSLFAGMAAGDRLEVRDSLGLMLCDDGLGDAFAAMTAVSETLASADLNPSPPASPRP